MNGTKDPHGLNKAAPRVTLMEVEQAIKAEFYFTAADGVHGALAAATKDYEKAREHARMMRGASALESLSLVTFCVLVLDNGFVVHGFSKCVSPENFDAQIGRDLARQKALDEVWTVLGFRLAERLANEANAAKARQTP